MNQAEKRNSLFLILIGITGISTLPLVIVFNVPVYTVSEIFVGIGLIGGCTSLSFGIGYEKYFSKKQKVGSVE